MKGKEIDYKNHHCRGIVSIRYNNAYTAVLGIVEPRTTGAWAMYGSVRAITPIAKGAEYIFKTGGCAANQSIGIIGVLSQDVDRNVIDDQYDNEDIKACRRFSITNNDTVSLFLF